jgi:tetratricopeptide (TPR) repeat protein
LSSPPSRSITIRHWLLLFVLWGGCATTGPGYIRDPQREKGLPSSAQNLMAYADALVSRTKGSARPSTLAEADRLLAALELAQEKGHPRPFEVLWRLSRACFYMTELLDKKDYRLFFAQQGEQYAKRAIELDARRVEPRYYLALNVAKETEATSKLGLIKTMIAEGEAAARLDETYDEAGPLRFLGKVYITAPAWPVSVGSSEKGVELLEKAVKIAPTPLNRLFLGQAYYKDDEPEQAKAELTRALQEAKAVGAALDPRWVKEAEELLRHLGGMGTSARSED